MKRIAFAASLALTLLASPVAQAASPQDRAMATGAVVGATTGAVIGSGSNQAVQGALVGAVFGTIAGAILVSNYDEPVYIAPRHMREHERREHHFYRREYREHHNARAHRQQVHYVAQHRTEHRRFDRD